ncbi:chorismate-pyruvate lyase [Saccharothrix ecbatanensis]|uniref:Chorismate-pyruvate lyase n=1 Tax=Saccharothrix ecbatanensis TaxID=1105145 RepID=A0A7W9HI56_9PSEU|nr:hypothetical protein [Saccharothrix ecbatanensis]MBB5802595.1 chorismate-pyruvate lyase [Saccharothrix ecbatanensis]
MIHSVPAARPDDAEARAETMARFLRDVPVPFTRVLSLWVGYRLRRDPRQPDTPHSLTPRQAHLLGLPPHATVTRREGYLVPYLGDQGPRLAAITALVHRRSLELDEPGREDLAKGYVPLGVLVTDARRATHYATTTRAPDDPDFADPLPDEPDDVPALWCQATLLSAGRPVALVRETVYRAAFTGRRPPDLSFHLPPAPPLLVS